MRAMELALEAALSGMSSQEQVMEWVRACEWDEGPDVAFMLAGRAPEAFVEKALGYCVSAMEVNEGRSGAILVAALAGATEQGRSELANHIMESCITDMKEGNYSSFYSVGRIRWEVDKYVKKSSDHKWMPHLVERIVTVAAAVAASTRNNALVEAMVEKCIDCGVDNPPSSKKLAAVAKILLKKGIGFDAEVISWMQKTMRKGCGREARTTCWPGTWINIATAIDGGAAEGKHDPSMACRVAISQILEDTRKNTPDSTGRRMVLLEKLAAGTHRPESLDLIIAAVSPAEWSPNFVKTIMNGCPEGQHGGGILGLKVVLRAVMGSGDAAWDACMAMGGAGMLEAWAGDGGQGISVVGQNKQALDPQEVRAGRRIANSLGHTSPKEVALQLKELDYLRESIAEWNFMLLEAAISGAQMEALAPASPPPSGSRPRI